MTKCSNQAKKKKQKRCVSFCSLSTFQPISKTFGINEGVPGLRLKPGFIYLTN